MGKEIDKIVENSVFAGASLQDFCEQGILPLLEQAIVHINRVEDPERKAKLYLQLTKMLMDEKNSPKSESNPHSDKTDYKSVIEGIRR